MADAVERRITVELLEHGRLDLADGERKRLGLPLMPAEVRLQWSELDGSTSVVEAAWHPRDRCLSGEAFTERLQLYGRENGLLRIEHDGDGIWRLELRDRAEFRLESGPRRADVQPVAASAGEEVRNRRRQRRAERRQTQNRRRNTEDYRWSGSVGQLKVSLDRIAENLRAGGWDSQSSFELRLEAEELNATSDFDELLAVDLAAIDHMPHQEGAARKVLGQLGGRAVLADEVGLGKTIEAGLILKELSIRGLADRMLILAPSTLREQWRDELQEKFREDFTVLYRSADYRPGARRLVMSVDLATRLRDRLAAEAWDVVVVDEAHKVTGAGARARQDLLRRLSTARYQLYLTATPVQNNLLELYRLVEMIRPGTFRSEADFRRRFCGSDARTPVNPAELRRLVADVMVRTTREQAGIDSVARYPVDVPVELGAAEREAYRICVDLLRHAMTGPSDHFRRSFLAKRLTTSPRSLATTAAAMAEQRKGTPAGDLLRELAELSLGFGITPRQRRLLDLVHDWAGDRVGKGRAIVFTQHADTLQDLYRLLEDEGITTEVFHGGLTSAKRQAAIRRFRDEATVLLSTDAGAEGLNLQFANCVINYDLPWNPMRIEQRIGRVHRVTQTRDVHVANFFARNTIDEHVYGILHDKLKMFELLFGQVTTILGELDDDDGKTFEGRVMDALASSDDATMARKLKEFGDKIERAYGDAQQSIRSGAQLGWMTDKQYRVDLPGREARELMPTFERRERQRHRRTALLVRRSIGELGGQIVHETLGDDREAVPEFITARFPTEVGAALEWPEELHLAFTSEALQQHADAELCAVGSEVFEELLDALRDRGDLHARIVRSVTDDELRAIPDITAAGGLRRVDRRVLGPVDWAATGHWRVQSDGSATGATLLPICAGERGLLEAPGSTALAPGESLPATLPEAAALVEAVAADALTDLEALLQLEMQQRRDEFEAEQERIIESFRAQLLELDRRGGVDASDQRGRLLRAIEQRRGMRPPESEVRAELIALELVAGGAVRIAEDWETPGGRRFAVEYRWDPASRARDLIGADGAPIAELAVCADLHAVDRAAALHCPSCGEDRCSACGPRARFRDCPCCGVSSCGACCPDRRTACSVCRSAERASELDRPGLIGWKIGDRGRLLVGTGSMVIELTGRPDRHVLPQDVLHDRPAELLGHLAARGLPLDCPVAFAAAPAGTPPPFALLAQTNQAVHWSDDPTVPVGPVDPAIVSVLSPVAAVEVNAIEGSGLSALFASLRRNGPKPDQIGVRVAETVVGEWVTVDVDGVRRERVVGDGRTGTVDRDVQQGPWEQRHGHMVAVATLEGVTASVRRTHRSYTIACDWAGQRAELFLPGHDSAVEELERSLAHVAERLGLPVGATAELPEVLLAASVDPDLVPRTETVATKQLPVQIAQRLLARLREIDPMPPSVPEPFQAADPAVMPADYAAAGLQVSVTTSRLGNSVYLLDGENRREAVVATRQGSAGIWWNLADYPIPAVTLALARLVGHGDLRVSQRSTTLADPPDGCLLLDEEATAQARVEFAGTMHRLELPGSGGLDERLAARLQGPTPQPLPESFRTLVAAFLPGRPARNAEPVVVTLGWVALHRWLDRDGLVARTSFGTEHSETRGPWRLDDGPVLSGEAGWDPVPSSRAVCELQDLRAQVVQNGAAGWVAVERDGALWKLWTLAGSEDDVRSLQLSRFLATDHPLSVSKLIAPNDIDGPKVNGATMRSRHWQPFAAEPSGATSQHATLQAATMVGLEAPCTPPTAGILDGTLRVGLSERLARPLTRSVDIGLEVTEQWQAADRSVEIRYRVEPSSPYGVVVAYDSGVPVRTVKLDREGHLAAQPLTCPYCAEATCSRCVSAVRACPLCAVAICGQCIVRLSPPDHDLGLCEACTTLSFGSVLSRLRAKGRNTLYGIDRIHTVTLIRPTAREFHVIRHFQGDSPVELTYRPDSPGFAVATRCFERA
jgi:superfamily II DNA or RNA helicase